VNYTYLRFGLETTVKMLDKNQVRWASNYATKAGLSIGIDDMVIPEARRAPCATPKRLSSMCSSQYLDGAITNGERYNKVIEIWSGITEKVADEMFGAMQQKDKEGVIQSDLRHGGFRRSRFEATDSSAFRMRGLMAKAFRRNH